MNKVLLLLASLLIIGYGFSQTVTTNAATNISYTTVTLNASGASLNSAKTYYVKFYWEVSGTAISGSSSHSSTASVSSVTSANFTLDISGLSSNQAYHFNAYLYESGFPSDTYKGSGSELTFTTSTVTTPSVTSGSVANVNYTSFDVNANNVTDDGGQNITEQGLVYSSTTNPPTTAHSKQTYTPTGKGTFDVSLSSLSSGTTYYVRAYAINASGTTYGATITQATTATSAPTVTTGNVANQTNTSSDMNGNDASSDGGASITDKGVCYGTSTNPTTEYSSGSTGTGTFNRSLTAASANTTYFGRAYAKNSAGTGYGANREFKTAPNAPAIANVTDSAYTEFTAKWNNAGTGVSYLLDVSTVSDFSSFVGSYHDFVVAAGTYQHTVTALTHNTQYYYRVRGKNDGGPDGPDAISTYSSNGDCKTKKKIKPEVTSGSLYEYSSGTIYLGHSSDLLNIINNMGAAALTEKGIEYKIGAGGAVTKAAHSNSNGNNWEQAISGLVEGTQYYMRAYAINSEGTGYGAWKIIGSQPTTVASFDSISGEDYHDQTKLTINWSGGSGDGQVIFCVDMGMAINTPADGSTWTGNAHYTSGTQNENGYCVYYGAGSSSKAPQSLEITGLNKNKDYQFYIYEYNNAAGASNQPNYKNDASEGTNTTGNNSEFPIKLLSFNSKKLDNAVEIFWTTVSEKDNDYFEVERSSNNEDFEVIASIAGAGNSNTELNYSIIDKKSFSNIMFYRLKQTDFDGNNTYSNSIVVSKNIEGISVDNIANNDNKISFNFNNPNNDNTEIQLIDMNGKVIKTLNIKESKAVTINMDGFTKGAYVLNFISSSRILIKKIVY